jgi:lipopolysaccharide biosynthesis regulator YciM
LTERSGVKAHYLQGRAYLRKNDLDRALPSFGRVLREDPEFVNAYYQVGEIFRQKNELQKSRDYFANYRESTDSNRTARNSER